MTELDLIIPRQSILSLSALRRIPYDRRILILHSSLPSSSGCIWNFPSLDVELGYLRKITICGV